MSKPFILKQIFSRILPVKYFVPAKYYYNKLIGTLEPEIDFIFSISKKNNHGRAIDVGANLGLFTYVFYLNGYAVNSFEPNEKCYSRLRQWAKAKKRVTVSEFAVSDDCRTTDLFIPVDKYEREIHALGTLQKNNTFESLIKKSVPTITIDSLLFDDVRIIKIDVEGHEINVIKGAINTIVKCRPIIICEIEQRHNKDDSVIDVFMELIKLDYECYTLNNKALVKHTIVEISSIINISPSSKDYIFNYIFIAK
jgi:FkbM family methyltransferase